jgi:hypothetical protein
MLCMCIYLAGGCRCRCQRLAMTNHISIQVEDDDQYERLQQARERYGLTWKGLLVQGVFHVQQQDSALAEDEDES